MSTLLVAGLVLVIEAVPTVRWSIDCELRDVNRSDRLLLDGAGPLRRPLDAGRADCMVTLQAGQQLTVMLADSRGSRARSTIAGVGSKARLHQG
ncbi:MAG: hypothetical protein WAS21_23365 [Geminicoccaceae bacterium]